MIPKIVSIFVSTVGLILGLYVWIQAKNGIFIIEKIPIIRIIVIFILLIFISLIFAIISLSQKKNRNNFGLIVNMVVAFISLIILATDIIFVLF